MATSRRPLRERLSAYRPAGPAVTVDGHGTCASSREGPSLPPARSLDRLASWTTFGGEELRSFSGTATYTVTLPRTDVTAAAWQLDLGDVRESARVR